MNVVEVIYWVAVGYLLISGLFLAPIWAKFLFGGIVLLLFEIHTRILERR